MIYNMRGDTYHAGPVMLSDVYTSAVGSAKDGVAASQRALYDAYNSLNSSISNIYERKHLATIKEIPPNTGKKYSLSETPKHFRFVLISWRPHATGVLYTYIMVPEYEMGFALDTYTGQNAYGLLTDSVVDVRGCAKTGGSCPYIVDVEGYIRTN